MRDFDREFVDQVRVARARAGWSQQRLADALKEAGYDRIHQTTVARIENGERRVTIGEALHIAALLDFHIEGVKHDQEVETLRNRHERIKAIIDGQED